MEKSKFLLLSSLVLLWLCSSDYLISHMSDSVLDCRAYKILSL